MLTARRRLLALLAAHRGDARPCDPPPWPKAPTMSQAPCPCPKRLPCPKRPAMSRITAFAFSFSGLDGGDIKLADHAGKPILVVNTASLCGYTPQYAGLQQLWTRYHERGPDDRRGALE